MPLVRIEAAKWGMRVCSEPNALDDKECLQLSLPVGRSVALSVRLFVRLSECGSTTLPSF